MKDFKLLFIVIPFIAILLIAMLYEAAKQHAPDQYLIHCRKQTSLKVTEDVYYVVQSYWMKDGCFEAKYHGELLTNLCACHIESDKKYDEWMKKRFDELVE